MSPTLVWFKLLRAVLASSYAALLARALAQTTSLYREDGGDLWHPDRVRLRSRQPGRGPSPLRCVRGCALLEEVGCSGGPRVRTRALTTKPRLAPLAAAPPPRQ